MMGGENVKAYAKLSCSAQQRQRVLPDFSSGTCAAAFKVSTSIADIRCKPWVFVSFGPSQKKEPLGGGEPNKACEAGNLYP